MGGDVFTLFWSLLVLATLPAPLANKRIMTMSDATFVLEQAEELLTFQVSDEALEKAAGSVKENAFTLGSCTGMSVCPMTAPV
jgi:hypothetical protein